MKSTRLVLPLLCIFSLLFAQQAGAAHAVHHAFEDLTHQQEDKKNAPHSDACEQCANYMQLGSALNVGAYEFTPPVESGEAIQHCTIAFRSIPVLAAAARGPPCFS